MAAKNVSQLLPPVAATMDVTYYGSVNCSTSQSATAANCKYHYLGDIVCGSVGGALASASAGHVAVKNESRCQGVWREGVHCNVRVFSVVSNGDAYPQ
jgi:hypothetical protein